MRFPQITARFSAFSFQNSRKSSEMREHLTSIFLAGVASVRPENLIKRTVRVEDNNLIVCDKAFRLQKPCYLVGFGKAVYGMALEVEKILGRNLQKGILTVPTGTFEKFGGRPKCSCGLRFIEGARNNLPDADAFKGAVEIKKLVEELTEDNLLIVLVSGGGSALLPYPKEPMSLEEKQVLIRDLSRDGADILELNSVRKKLSELKGGGLAKFAHPAKVVGLVLSDIVGDPLDFIASGPTVTNVDPSNRALDIVRKYGLFDKLSEHVKDILTSEDSFKVENAENFIIGNNKIAAEACRIKAEALGYDTRILSTKIQDDVEALSKFYAELSFKIHERGNKADIRDFLASAREKLDDIDVEEILTLDSRRNICIIAAGEPTVVVRGSGSGGRNQELALRFSVEVNKFSGAKMADISFLSAGTDGMDGPTDAAGALGSSNLVNKAALLDIRPTQFLANNDSYRFYSAFDGGSHLIKISHTGTNVMDVHVIIIGSGERMEEHN